MAITYTWQIANLESNVADGGVVTAHWRCTGVDGEFNATAYGTIGFTPDASAPDFVPYADLTEADVLAWVWASEEGTFKDKAEAAIAQKIESDKAPAVQSGLPWAE